VTHQGEVELAFSEFHRWGGPLADNLTDVVTLNIGAILPSAMVVNDRMDHQLHAGYRVHVEVLRMTGELGKDAELAVRWSITDNQEGRMLDMSVSRQREPLVDQSHRTYVTAISRMLMNVSMEIATSLKGIVSADDNG